MYKKNEEKRQQHLMVNFQSRGIVEPMYTTQEAPVAQSVERLTANLTTPAGLWFDPQSEQNFQASCPPRSDG